MTHPTPKVLHAPAPAAADVPAILHPTAAVDGAVDLPEMNAEDIDGSDCCLITSGTNNTKEMVIAMALLQSR